MNSSPLKKKHFKQTFSRHVKASAFALMLLCGFIGFTAYLYVRSNDIASALLPWVLFGSVLVPQAILHLEYYIVNKGGELIVDEPNSRLIYNSKSKKINLSLIDISKIEKYQSIIKENDPLPKFGLPWNDADYFYYKLFINDGGVIFITCLLVDDISMFETKESKTYNVFFPSIRVQEWINK